MSESHRRRDQSEIPCKHLLTINHQPWVAGVGYWQSLAVVATAACRLHGKHWLVSKHSWTSSRAVFKLEKVRLKLESSNIYLQSKSCTFRNVLVVTVRHNVCFFLVLSVQANGDRCDLMIKARLQDVSVHSIYLLASWNIHFLTVVANQYLGLCIRLVSNMKI